MPTSQVIQFIPPQPSLPVSPSIELVHVRPHRDLPGIYSVKMNIMSDPSSLGMNFLLETFESLGIAQSFTEEFKNDKSKFDDIAVFELERRNLKSGVRISLGFILPGTFVDPDPELYKRLFSPGDRATKKYPKKGEQYKYTIKLYLRPPSAFFSEKGQKLLFPAQEPQLIGQQVQELQNAFFETLITKVRPTWLEQITSTDLGFWNAPEGSFANSSQGGNLLGGNIYAGDTGREESETITCGVHEQPSIDFSSFTSSQDAQGRIVLSWSVQGNLTAIHSFVIFGRYLQTTAPIDSLSSWTLTPGTYTFLDRRLSALKGDITYGVYIILSNFAVVKPAKWHLVKRGSNLPKVVLTEAQKKVNKSKE